MSCLFTPVTIGGLMPKKRLVMPPMATAKAEAAGRVTREVCDHSQGRARYSKIWQNLQGLLQLAVYSAHCGICRKTLHWKYPAGENLLAGRPGRRHL